MKTNSTAATADPDTTGTNIVSLNVKQARRRRANVALARFKIVSFTNPRTGTQSFRVAGAKRNGERVRENFTDHKAAECRRIELETEFLGKQTETAIRATKLTDGQLRIAENCYDRLEADHELTLAVEHWLRDGKQRAAVTESPRLDDAVEKFKKWLDGEADENGNSICTLRDHSRRGLRVRVNIFANSTGNLRVNDITADTVESFLGKLKVSAVTRDNYRRALSRFFSWSIERPRRWTALNPCREIKIEKGEKPSPEILSLADCKTLLQAAEPAGLAPYVAVCLFAGLRPFEASRLDWSAVNLRDKEIRLEANQTKTGQPRVVAICPTLRRWLKAYEGKPFFPSGWRKKFDKVKRAAGFAGRAEGEGEDKLKPWPIDVLRHTAISHFFRKAGSYGLTAEQFGNSEAIIKKHYQGRVSSDDTKKFYALRPSR